MIQLELALCTLGLGIITLFLALKQFSHKAVTKLREYQLETW
ncbi:MAG TPA: hypothetical protein VHH33_05285 [Nitrososphaeraceae archaeon]|nr:hypothetical protein [Nitrososphaeraceae archaeon]